MRFRVIFYLIITVLLNSCASPKAENFRDFIVSQERVAFDIIAGKNGAEFQKQEYIINENYSEALKAVEEQKKMFRNITQQIRLYNSDGIEQAGSLKKAALDYYTTLGALYYYDKGLIELQMSHKEPTQIADFYSDMLKKKKKLYEELYRKELLLSKALNRFENANNLR